VRIFIVLIVFGQLRVRYPHVRDEEHLSRLEKIENPQSMKTTFVERNCMQGEQINEKGGVCGVRAGLGTDAVLQVVLVEDLLEPDRDGLHVRAKGPLKSWILWVTETVGYADGLRRYQVLCFVMKTKHHEK